MQMSRSSLKIQKATEKHSPKQNYKSVMFKLNCFCFFPELREVRSFRGGWMNHVQPRQGAWFVATVADAGLF